MSVLSDFLAGVKSTASKAKAGVKKAASYIPAESFANPSKSTAVPGITSGAKLVKDLAVGTARLPVTLPTKALLTFTNTPSYTPVTGLEKFLVGSTPVASYTSRQKSIQKWAKDKGLSSNQAIAIGAIGAIGEAGLDFFTGGKWKTVNTIADIAKANTTSKVSKIVKQANLSIPKETFELLAKETDPIKISKIINIGIEDSNFRKSVTAGLSQRAAAVEKEIQIANRAPVIDLEKIAKLEQERIDIPKMAQNLQKMDPEEVFDMGNWLKQRGVDPFKINEQGLASGVLPGRIELPKVAQKVDPLIKEARKYKSAEEFGNNVFYRGIGKNAEQNAKRTRVGNQFGEGLYASPNKDFAGKYGDLHAVVPKKGAKFHEVDRVISDEGVGQLYDRETGMPIEDIYRGLSKYLEKHDGDLGPAYADWAKAEGFDGIKIFDESKGGKLNEVMMFDKNAHQTIPLNKSQLTDLWKEANKTKTLKGFVGGGKLPEDAPAKKVMDFIKGKKEKKPSATETVVSLLKEKKKTTEALKKIEDQIAPIVEGKMAMKEFSDDIARGIFNEKIYQGIKNSPFFRKEGEIKDIMGEGFLMKKGDRYVVATSADAASMEAKGYERLMEIDSFANEAGFENGEEYLRAVLKSGEDLKPVNILKQELESIPEAKSYLEKLKEISGALKGSFDLKSLRAGINVGKSLTQEKLKVYLKGLNGRKELVAAVQKFFGLSDKDMLKLGARKNFANMTEGQFKNFLHNLEPRAQQYAERSQARAQVVSQIVEKELQKVDNFRKAMQLPPIDKMSTSQLIEFDRALTPFMKGDEFLSVRKLETVGNTELAGISTLREAKEILAKKLGVPIESVSNIKSTALDRLRYDTSLAEKNPFYRLLVDETNQAMLSGEARFLSVEKRINDLIKKARSSSDRSFIDRLVPTDKKIFAYLESNKKAELAKDMTNDELIAAEAIREQFAIMRDYLVSKKQLENVRENYITHIRRGFLETWKDDGVVKAFKDVFSSMKEDEAVFNILSGDTGEILPLEKFFQYSMRRSGVIQPSQNVAKAFMSYSKAFEKKRALDSLIPKLEIYTDALTPKNLTSRGLEMDRSLKNFVKTWMNTKKGRVVDISGVVPQGGTVDILLKAGLTMTRVLDLGLNVPIGVAAQGGEQTMNLLSLGVKNYLKGTGRMATKQGQNILENYKNFVGRTPWDTITDASKNIIEKAETAAFSLFQDATVRANKQFLLGSLTDQEFKSGVISPERLAMLKREMGRYRVVEESKSILGSTSPGRVWTQYKTWAIPPLRTTIDNLAKIAKSPSKLMSREGQELLRGAILMSVVYMTGKSILEKKDKKNKSFFEDLSSRVVRDAMTLIGALDPTLWTAAPRLTSFAADLSSSMKMLVTLEEYKRDSGKNKEGELKFDNKLKSTLVPKAIKRHIDQPSEFERYKTETKSEKEEKRSDFKPTYKEIRALDMAGNGDEAQARVEALSEEEYQMYSGMRKAEKAKNSSQLRDYLDYDPAEAVKFLRSMDEEEQNRLLENMSDEEYALYEEGKSLLSSKKK